MTFTHAVQCLTEAGLPTELWVACSKGEAPETRIPNTYTFVSAESIDGWEENERDWGYGE